MNRKKRGFAQHFRGIFIYLKESAGFTYVELIIAMIVVVITVVVTLEFYRFCLRNFIIGTELKLMASNFARETMEEVYWLDPSHPDMAVGDHPRDLPAGSKLGAAALRTYTVTNRPNYRIIEVKVTWTR